jgi:hypothetical protein
MRNWLQPELSLNAARQANNRAARIEKIKPLVNQLAGDSYEGTD